MPYNQRSVDPTVEKLIPPDLTLLSSSSIAALWSSYGHIYRISTISKEKDEKTPRLLVLKHIHPPRTTHASLSHSRKLTSYAVERYFYTELAPRLPPTVAVARAYPTAAPGILLLDDLSTDFPRPAWGSLGAEDTRSVLRWLAGFHATFWGVKGTVPPPVAGQVAEVGAESRGVWEQGTYYYLDTRREEMADVDAEGDMNWIVPWADRVNDALAAERAANRSTLLHGDAKGANILFSPSGECAFVDFQYVGEGVPTLDLIYFLGTSIESRLLRADGEVQLLKFYWDTLQTKLSSEKKDIKYEWDTFQRQWELAIVDWCRFMAGWGFWGNDTWVTRRAREIVQKWEADGIQ